MLLLEAVKAQTRSAGQGSNNQNAARIQDAYNRSISNSTNSQKSFVKSIIGSTASFVKELAVGGTRASDFSTALFGANSSITGLVKQLDGTLDTWRDLSSVGASFNNSIFDMMASSADSSMSLDEFASMVKNNSEVLSALGGTVTTGAKIFGNFSKSFRQGVGSQLFEMGFTISDINEGLLLYADLETRRSTRALTTDKKTQLSAENYILQLDKLSKLTGIERKQLADKISQQQTDAGIAARINALNEDQRANLQNAIAMFETKLPGFSEGFKDLMDGVAQTDLGKALETSIPGIGQYMQQVFTGEEDINEVLTTLQKRFGPALANYATQFEKEGVDQMRMAGGVTGAIAELLDSQYQLNALSQLDAEAAEKEQARRNALTAALSKFEQAIIDFRTTVVDTFYEIAMAQGGLFDAFSNLGTALSNAIGDGGSGITGFREMLTNAMTWLFGPNGKVTNGINTLAEWMTGDSFKNFVTGLENSISNFTVWFDDVIKSIQDKGLWETIKEQFSGFFNTMTEFWNGPMATQLRDTIAGFFKQLIDLMQDTFVNSSLAAMLGITDRESVASRQAETALADREAGRDPTKIDAQNALTGILGKGFWNLSSINMFGQGSQDLVDPAIISSLLGTVNEDEYWTRGGAIQDALQKLGDQYEAGTLSADQQALFEKAVIAFTKAEEDFSNQMPTHPGAPTPHFANGTNGFQNFGRETMALLHNSEAVVPRNSPAGDVLQAFYDAQSKGSSQSNIASPAMPASDTSQSSLLKKVEELNNTMIKVAELLENSVGLQAKTVKGVKGLNTDFYRGIGR